MSDEPVTLTLPFFDLADPTRKPGIRSKRRKIDATLAEVRRLADELNRQLYTCPASERPQIHCERDAADLFLPFLGSLEHEELWVMCLNTRNRVIALTRLYSGSVNQAQVRVGEIFRHAIAENAVNIIIAHNHPTGESTPSPDDVALTRAICQAGKLLDITLLDHIIIAADSYTSLKARGLGFSD